MTFLTPPAIIAILIALSVHEWAHGYVAWKLGDPTAKYEGRLTLNPVAHLDPMGTLLFLIVGFGWGKPVPINPRYFKNHRRDTALTAIAGPVSNLILAFCAFVLLTVFFPGVLMGSVTGLLSTGSIAWQSFLAETLSMSLFINLGLMAFNLLPIAPLDGSKILAPFIPRRYEYDYERFMQYGPFLLLGLLLADRILGIPVFYSWMTSIMNAVLNVMFLFT